jgi:hypothetical protein
MASTISFSAEAAERARWTEHYRTLTVSELIARTISLRISARRGNVAAKDAELQFQVLEAEQVRRSTVKLTGAQRGALEAFVNADERGLPMFGAVDFRLKRMGLIEYVGGHAPHRMHTISAAGIAALIS